MSVLAAGLCPLHENAVLTNASRSCPLGIPTSGQRPNTSWVTRRSEPRAREDEEEELLPLRRGRCTSWIIF